MKVGWIGLGHMGEPMARRVLGAGHELFAHSRRPAAHDNLRTLGAQLTRSLAEVAAVADVLCVCVFDDPQLNDALITGGALAAMKSGSILAVHSTGAPTALLNLETAAPPGVQLLDAPFSGTSEHAAAGGLTLMIGGMTEALETARPVLSSFAGRILHVGAVGDGRRIKLVNNLTFAAQIVLAHEILELAEGMGLEPNLVAQTIQHGSGASYAMAKFAGAIPARAVLDAIRPYMIKDVAIARTHIIESGNPVPSAVEIALSEFGNHE